MVCSENIPHDYECRLEIYAYEHHEDLTIASAQVKLKKRISDISNTVGRRLSGLSLVGNLLSESHILSRLRD